MPFGLPPLDPGIEIFAASQGMSQGLLQSRGPQIVPRISLSAGDVELGNQWRNISSPAASGIAAFFVKVRARRGKTRLEGAVIYRLRTGARHGVDRAAWEIDATVRQQIGKVGIRIAGEFAPKDFESGPVLYLEAGPSYPIAKSTSLSANIGLSERDGPDHMSFDAGVTRTLGRRLSVDARFHSTDHQERGQRYRARFIVSTRISL